MSNHPNNRAEWLAERVAERTDEENRDWERAWRQYVGVKLDKHDLADEKLAEQQAKTAQIIERVLARLDTLEERPGQQRALFGLANSTLYTIVGIVALGFDAFTTVLAFASAVVAVLALIHH